MGKESSRIRIQSEIPKASCLFSTAPYAPPVAHPISRQGFLVRDPQKFSTGSEKWLDGNGAIGTEPDLGNPGSNPSGESKEGFHTRPPCPSPRLFAPPLLQIRPTPALLAFCAGAGSSPRPPHASGGLTCAGGG